MQNPEPGVTSLSPEPDTELADGDAIDAALAASGDAVAFERLYRAHAGRVHALARRMATVDEAPEITQDVFVRAWHKLGTFRGEAAFGTWLYRLAVNVILARRGRLGLERARHEEPEILDVLPARHRSSDLAMDFESAIGLLPAGARRVFVLHDVEGYKHQEIAEMLGIASGTSKAQLHRARMALRRHLAR
jgi:RNA polymerase sigma-70 factor (ECF subfamily)